MKKIIFFIFLLFSVISLSAQRIMENLDRGLVAAMVTNGVYVNWRITGQEWNGVAYNLYRDNVKINATPIMGASNYIDASGTLTSKYKVRAIVNGIEQAPSAEVSVLPQAQINITLHPIPTIAGVPDSYYTQYKINDITAADLDGDGEYELIIKRVNEGYDSSNPFENKYYTLFDAYKLDGTFLWRIDVGPNIFHNVEITCIAYDFDLDGKAEVVMRTSEGTVDGLGNVIGDLGNAMGQPTPDGKTNYRDKLQYNSQWFEYEGPEYLSLFDGETGEMLDRIDHIARQPVSQWGAAGTGAGGLAHRATKFFYGAPYLDGKKPSLFISRGIYHRIKLAAYDIVNKQFQSRWSWDSNTEPTYASQGNHNYSIADVDNDGRDEIVYGSMVIDDNGTGLYSTQLGHGDALHVGDFDPFRKGLEVFACLENSPYHGTTFRAAEDGSILLQFMNDRDTGRSMAANVTNNNKGAELWPSPKGVFSASERKEISLPGGYSFNFRIYWDGDLLEELVDHNWNSSLGKGEGVVQKQVGTGWQNLLVTSGYYSCNHTKGTPCLQADLFGDWREELIFRSNDDNSIAIFFTTDYTDHRIYTLMHDMQYRQAIAWQMCGYNQPPHTSFFLGEREGITLPPPPVMDNQKLVFTPASSAIWSSTSTNWTKDKVAVAYATDEDLLFDMSGHINNIQLADSVAPKSMTVNSPSDYTMDMQTGKLSGAMKMIKQGNGKFQFNGNHDYTGTTEIWDGSVIFNGKLQNTSVWLNLFAEFAVTGTVGDDLSLNYASVLYPGGKQNVDSLKITSGDLNLKQNSIVEFDLSTADFKADVISIQNGIFNFEGGAIFRFVQLAGQVPAGTYNLMDVATIQGSLDSIEIAGLESRIAHLSYSSGKLILTIADARSTNDIVWKGELNSAVWDRVETENFTLNSANTYFVQGDNVLFDDSSNEKTVNVTTNVSPSQLTITTNTAYTFTGTGKIGGAAALTKNGTGKLTLMGQNDYSGATIINNGILSVESMPNLVYNGSIGVKSDNPELFVLNNATLTAASSATIASQRAIKMGTGGGTFDTNVDFDWNANITGNVLTKKGSKTLSLLKATSVDTLKIAAGTIWLRTEEAYPAKNVYFESGTLSCYDNSGTYSTANWNIIVPQGKYGTINLDSRCEYTGKLTGAGSLTVMAPFSRNYLQGNWSAFTGTVIATTDGDGGDFAFKNNYGLANAELNVAGALYVYNDNGTSFALGALSGVAAAKLSGNHEWVIGAKNTSTTYAGTITAGSISKVGTGTLTLTNTNTYTGATTVTGGRLLLKNTSTTESALGTGTVAVDNAAYLGGTGIVKGNVIVRNGGTVEPGDETASSWSAKIGTFTFESNLTLLAGGTLAFSVRNVGNNPSDLIVVKGRFAIAGDVSVEIVNGDTEFVVGDKLKLFDLTSATITGSFTNINLPPVAVGSQWDTSKILTEGTVEVVAKSSIVNNNDADKNINVYPNPADDYVTVEFLSETTYEVQIIDIQGRIVISTTCSNNDKIDISSLSQGYYTLRINDGIGSSFKLIKK